MRRMALATVVAAGVAIPVMAAPAFAGSSPAPMEGRVFADQPGKPGTPEDDGAGPRDDRGVEPSAAPGPLRIYLARHGQTDWNAARRLQGSTDVPLNDTGRAQARALAARVARLPLDAIYASGLSRSLETARIVAGDRPVRSLPQLNEQSLGGFEGKQIGEGHAETAAEFDRRRADPDDRMDGGESVNQHLARVEAALAMLRARHPSGSILIVGHGGTNQLLLRLLLGLSAAQAEEIHQDNSELYLVEVVPGQPPVLWKQIPADRLGEL